MWISTAYRQKNLVNLWKTLFPRRRTWLFLVGFPNTDTESPRMSTRCLQPETLKMSRLSSVFHGFGIRLQLLLFLIP